MMYELIARTSTNWHLFSVARVCTCIIMLCRYIRSRRLYIEGRRLESRSDFRFSRRFWGIPPVERIRSRDMFLQMAYMSVVEPEVDVPAYEGVNLDY